MNDATGQSGQSSSGLVRLWQYTDVKATVPMRALALDVVGLQQAVGYVYQSADRAGQVPLWSGAELRPGTTRANENVERIWTFVGDLDDNTPLPVIRKWLSGLTFVAYPTYHWSADRERWRVIIPLVEPIPAEQYGQVWQQVNAQLFRGHLDPSTKDAARMHWLPCRHPDTMLPDGLMQVGETCDWRGLEPLPVAEPRYVAPVDLPTPTDHDARRALALVNTMVETLAGTPEGQRHTTLLQVATTAGGLVEAGLIAEDWLVDRLLVASEQNGLVESDGAASVERAIGDGIAFGRQKPWTPSSIGDRPGWTPEPPNVIRLGARHNGTIGSEKAPDLGATTTAPLEQDGVLVSPLGLTYRTLRALREMAPADVDWIVHGYLAAGTLVQMHGDPKAGKTTLMLHAVRGITRGETVLGRRTRQTRVLIMSEQPYVTFLAQVAEAGLADSDEVLVMPFADFSASVASWADKLADAGLMARLFGAEMLVIDTYLTFAGLDGDNSENNSGLVKAASQPLLKLRDDGLLVWLSHHERKAGGGLVESSRGSSLLAGTVDVIMRLEMLEDPERRLTATGRFPVDTPHTLTIRLESGEYRALETRLGGKRDEIEPLPQYVVETFHRTADQALTVSEIVPRVMKHPAYKSPDQIRKIVERAAAAGHLDHNGLGTKSDPLRYWRTAVAAESDEEVP